MKVFVEQYKESMKGEMIFIGERLQKTNLKPGTRNQM